MAGTDQQQDPFAVASVTPIDKSATVKADAQAASAPAIAPTLTPAAPVIPQGAHPFGVASVTKLGSPSSPNVSTQSGVPASVAAVQPPQVTQRRYTAPGQGVQEFTAGSTEEQRFLQKFPQAKMIPQTYQRNLQPQEHIDTETPAAQTARETAQAHQTLKKTAVGTGAAVGAMVAPELLPFIAPELAAGTGLGTVAAGAGLEAGGAAAGTAAGQAVTGENPLTAENLTEAGKNAALFGGTRLAFGTGGLLLGKVADWVRGISKLPPDLEQASQEAIAQAGGGENQLTAVSKAKSDLDKAEAEMHQNYEKKYNEITKAANDAKVPVNIKGSEVQHVAEKLLNDSRLPRNIQSSLRKLTPDDSQLEPLLRDFTGVDEAGNPIPDWAPRQTWDETEATRQILGKKARELSYGSPLKYPLLQLRDALDATMEQSARDAGMPELSENIKNLRAQYAEKINLFQNNAIEQLRDKDPNAIAGILTSGRESIQNVKELRSLIGPENMKQVEGSILANLIQDSRNIDGSFNAQKLLNKFNNLGPDVRQAVWGDNLPEVEKFFRDAVKPNINGSAVQQIFGHLSRVSLAGRTGAGMVGGLALGLVHGDSPQRVLADMAVLGIGGAAPELAARYGPGVANALDTGADLLGAPRAAEAAQTVTPVAAEVTPAVKPTTAVPASEAHAVPVIPARPQVPAIAVSASTAPTAVTPESRYADFVNKTAQRIGQEAAGQGVLDDMEEKGISPRDVSQQFWNKTYFDLPAEAQVKFQNYLKSLTGFKPGDVIGTDANGQSIVAQDWNHIATDILDLSNNPAHLEGGDRGLVAGMKAANDRFSGVVKPKPTATPRAAIDRVATSEKAAAGKGVETSHTGTPDTLNTIKLTKDGEDIGMVNFTHDGSTASVGHTWVDSSVRSQGHGQSLLKEAAKKARLQGAKVLTSDPEGEMTAAARKPWEALKQQGQPIINTTINGKPGYEWDLQQIDADGKPIPPETDKVPTTKEGVKATTDFGKTAKTPSQSNTAASKTAAVAASNTGTSGPEEKKTNSDMSVESVTNLNPQAEQAKNEEEQPQRSVAELKEVVRNAAESHDVPADLLDAQAEQESKYDPKAVSHKGARGLMQFMPATAREMGVVNPEDPEESADRGAELMASLKKRFGTWDKALAGYNANPDRVQQAIDDYGDEWLYHLPEETQNYVHAIMRKFALAKTAHVPRIPGQEGQQ